MFSKEVVVKNKSGLHARPASVFIQEANKFQSNITILFGDKEFNGKSIIALLSAGIVSGSKITLQADGADEKEAVEVLTDLIENKLED